MAPKPTFIREYAPLLVLILLNVILGLWLGNDYGVSIDEPDRYTYTADILSAYQGQQPDTENEDFNVGSGYLILAQLGSDALAAALPETWLRLDVWHLFHFLFFQLGVVWMYGLARRFVSQWAAIGATLLFAYQPVLWGHAFINPKDTPFLTVFLGTVTLGLAWVDATAASPNAPAWRAPKLWLAALVFGLATATRILGPAAAGMVALYAFQKLGRRAWKPLLGYAAIAGVVATALWPTLWVHPLNAIRQLFSSAVAFPWMGDILFNGVIYRETTYPRSYVPVLLTLQLTEPLLILMVVGLPSALRQLKHRWDLALVGLWFLLPLAAVVIVHPIVYNNFRHFLFILPPLFVLAGFGLEQVGEWLSAPIWRGAVILAAILPGVYWNIQLHPYEYIYYNQLTGGVAGAFRQYELDYWTTSYREAAEFLNANAPANSLIAVPDGWDLFDEIMREDLKIRPLRNLKQRGIDPDFVIIRTNLNVDQFLLPDAPALFAVERDSVPLVFVKAWE